MILFCLPSALFSFSTSHECRTQGERGVLHWVSCCPNNTGTLLPLSLCCYHFRPQEHLPSSSVYSVLTLLRDPPKVPCLRGASPSLSSLPFPCTHGSWLHPQHSKPAPPPNVPGHSSCLRVEILTRLCFASLVNYT